MNVKFLDTNIVLRFLLADDVKKASACEALFLRMQSGREVAVASPLVIAEVVWVLEKFYKHPRGKIVSALVRILSLPGFDVDGKEILMTALGLYEIKNVDFIDAYHAVYATARGLSTIYSYDRDFDKLMGLQRVEP